MKYFITYEIENKIILIRIIQRDYYNLHYLIECINNIKKIIDKSIFSIVYIDIKLYKNIILIFEKCVYSLIKFCSKKTGIFFINILIIDKSKLLYNDFLKIKKSLYDKFYNNNMLVYSKIAYSSKTKNELIKMVNDDTLLMVFIKGCII